MDETTATSKIMEDNEENEKLRSQIQSLKERLQSASLIAEENAAKAKKYKTLADIAATQAQSTSHLNKVKKDAVLELRKQLHFLSVSMRIRERQATLLVLEMLNR